jgi:hypothetical protein
MVEIIIIASRSVICFPISMIFGVIRVENLDFKVYHAIGKDLAIEVQYL